MYLKKWRHNINWILAWAPEHTSICPFSCPPSRRRAPSPFPAVPGSRHRGYRARGRCRCPWRRGCHGRPGPGGCRCCGGPWWTGRPPGCPWTRTSAACPPRVCAPVLFCCEEIKLEKFKKKFIYYLESWSWFKFYVYLIFLERQLCSFEQLMTNKNNSVN